MNSVVSKEIPCALGASLFPMVSLFIGAVWLPVIFGFFALFDIFESFPIFEMFNKKLNISKV